MVTVHYVRVSVTETEKAWNIASIDIEDRYPPSNYLVKFNLIHVSFALIFLHWYMTISEFLESLICTRPLLNIYFLFLSIIKRMCPVDIYFTYSQQISKMFLCVYCLIKYVIKCIYYITLIVIILDTVNFSMIRCSVSPNCSFLNP